MALTLFNTLTKQKEIFTPSSPELVTIYACGPTPYDYAHIGNLRTYVFNDTLRRVLAFNNYQVKQVMNITDVDDKTIKASQAQNISLKNFTQKFEDLFWLDLSKLNILKPNITPHATDYIQQMISLIETLIAKKAAYTAPDGVYFALGQAEKYRQLSGRPKPETASQSEDFALWKFWKEEDGEVAWDAPFGRGRPGWHLECSAMIESEIGETVDIHTGGVDLIFPHHENELAQSESAHAGAPLARYWLHGGFVNVSDEKMSKSLNNFITLKSLEEKNITPLAYRYWLLQAKYRTTVNFTWEAVQAAQTGYERLMKKVKSLPEGDEVNQELKQQFLDAINDDLNTAKALTILPDNQKTWREFDKVLGLGLI
ncbi:MAG: cysteine--tRNA ligase [Patescibacteria group bacterium]